MIKNAYRKVIYPKNDFNNKVEAENILVVVACLVHNLPENLILIHKLSKIVYCGDPNHGGYVRKGPMESFG